MDYQAGAWLLVVHLATLIPAHTIEFRTEDRPWMAHDSREPIKVVAQQLEDVASPQRAKITGDVAAPEITQHYLKYTKGWHNHREIRYSLTAFGKDYQLILQPDRRFISPSFTVEHVSGSQSDTIPCGSDLLHCYYRGSVLGDPISSAVFDLCNGLRGAFKTHDGVYLVEPLAKIASPGLENVQFELNGTRHRIINYTAKASQSSHATLCGVEEKLLNNRTRPGHPVPHSLPAMRDDIHRRAKRETILQGAQSYPRYVELMFTADKSMLDHYGSEFEIKRYLHTVIGIVHSIFRDPKIGNSIEVVLTGIKILKDEKDLKVTSDARKSLRRFCKWQYKQNILSDSDPGHYDTAVLITRKDICRIKGSCETLGLAELGTMCDPKRSCSIVEDAGLGVAFTVAHELGHVFNIGHDALSKKCLGKKDGLHVMAPALNLQSMPWSWSSCSRQDITEFLEGGHDKCLMDKPQYQYKMSNKLPGEIYSPDMQCKQTYGKNSSLCAFRTKPCRRLWCSVIFPTGHHGCRSHAMPWAEGSACGKGKWCIRGICVPKRPSVKINGGWSPWSRFGPCSRTCGGGVTYSSRQCSNPSPSNGGKFCLGAKKRFKSCRTRDCPAGSPSFREVQCASYNGKRGPKGSKWVPRYLKGRHQCKIICERVGGGGFITAKAIDGTKCAKAGFDMCVNGNCRLAGCDNVLNSPKVIDECGVCGGRNRTCTRTYRTWHKKVRWGYNYVTTLFPGYSSIIIEQITPEIEKERRWGHTDDDNYLVLLDENYGNILNSGFSIRSEEKSTFEAFGLQITYSGSGHSPEFIKIKGRLKKKIHLQVLSVTKVLAPKITYSYIRPIKKLEKYTWDKKGPWSRCSHECQGWRKRKLVCRRERDGLLVPVSRCDPKRKPGTIKEHCNTYCLFKWMVSGRGTCKPGCGPGTQRIYYKCVKHDIKSGANLVLSNKHCRPITRPRSEQPCNGTCDNVLWVYTRWTACSKSCDGGLQTRRVTCMEKIAHVRNELPASLCSRIPKRSLQKPCNTQRCPSWKTGRWSRCSAACGEGYQRRKVSCWKGNKIAKDNACDLRKKPKERQNCRLKACPHWEYNQWSDCSITCGTGQQIRLVRCVDADGRGLKDEDCRAVAKPASRQECSGLRQCDKTVFLTRKVIRQGHVKWKPGDWGVCSARCGKGSRERRVSCVDIKTRVLNDTRCKHITKPRTVQDCFRYCGNWRYSDWTPCSSGCGRGTQRRQVKCFDRQYRLTEYNMCDPLLRPANIRQCSNYFCSPAVKPKPKTSGRWKSGSWTQCSRTCERGVKRRSVICIDGSSRRDHTEKSCVKIKKPSSEVSCNLGSCPQWKTKRWSKCSRTCDLGIVTREVYCANNRSILRDEKCNKKLKPTVKKSCFVKRCPPPSRWMKGSWNPCSVKCGEGWKKRHVWCEDILGKRISSIHCMNLRRKPKSIKKCRRNTCGIWETGLWGGCSSRCGTGESVRSVRCRRGSSFVKDEFCSSKDRPIEKKACHMGKCISENGPYKWFTTDWTPCTKTCGNGVKSRMVICVGEREIQVPATKCNPETKPPETVTCKIKECLPDWIVGHWSKCSKSCGKGVERRSVTCPRKDRNLTNLCDKEKRPAAVRRCNHGSCNGYFLWKTGPWSKCSGSCGEIRMRRAVKCVGRNRYFSPDTRCIQSGGVKPDTYRKCNLPPCVPKTCRDIQTQFGKQEDNEFELAINNKKVKVFCHGMLTNNPKEFITLKAGLKRNFAEYYHRSLKNPNRCPYKGARNDDCPHCHDELFPSSGGTYFSKVRLDISRMALIGDDFTYAVRRGRHAPTFGTAGDCYSKKRCPQGRFSIDLTNTGFSLARKVTWKSYGYHLSRVITIEKDRQVVSGMCGGYCGVCRPYRSLRIAV